MTEHTCAEIMSLDCCSMLVVHSDPVDAPTLRLSNDATACPAAIRAARMEGKWRSLLRSDGPEPGCITAIDRGSAVVAATCQRVLQGGTTLAHVPYCSVWGGVIQLPHYDFDVVVDGCDQPIDGRSTRPLVAGRTVDAFRIGFDVVTVTMQPSRAGRRTP
jgi:hypothetical protein